MAVINIIKTHSVEKKNKWDKLMENTAVADQAKAASHAAQLRIRKIRAT